MARSEIYGILQPGKPWPIPAGCLEVVLRLPRESWNTFEDVALPRHGSLALDTLVGMGLGRILDDFQHSLDAMALQLAKRPGAALVAYEGDPPPVCTCGKGRGLRSDHEAECEQAYL